MQKLERCDPPELTTLARTDSETTLLPYIPIINAQMAYWQRINTAAEHDASDAGAIIMADIGHSMHKLLKETFEVAVGERFISKNEEAYSHTRLFMLGITAVSLFARKYQFDQMPNTIEDGLALRTANFIFDTYNNPYRLPQAPRLHMAPELAALVIDVDDEPEGWYGTSQLYVHYSSVAEPTDEQRHVIDERNITIDFDPLITITPELRRR